MKGVKERHTRTDPQASYNRLKGILQIHPIHGFFYANDTRLYPVYEKCEKEGLPVLFHAGTTSQPLRGTAPMDHGMRCQCGQVAIQVIGVK